jgi:hypothetical protein
VPSPDQRQARCAVYSYDGQIVVTILAASVDEAAHCFGDTSTQKEERSMRRRFCSVAVLVLVALALVLGVGFHATAQETLLPVIPDPSECTVEPRTIDEVIALIDVLPAAEHDDEAGEANESFVVPEGEPADEATVDAIIGTAREMTACLNTGNLLTLLEFRTDRAFAELKAMPFTEEVIEFYRAGPPPLEPEMYATLEDVRAVSVLADGRVGAVVVTTFYEEPEVQYLIFEQVDDRWLIDEIVEDPES